MNLEDEIKRRLDYHPRTGKFTWRVPTRRSHPRVGTINTNGYVQFNLCRKSILGHRVAWLLTYGVWPDGEIDHINGDRADNRLSNLRLATRAENMRNRGVNRNNKVGLKGVGRIGKKWRARIMRNGKTFHIGVFESAEEANDAYARAAERLHEEFANPN